MHRHDQSHLILETSKTVFPVTSFGFDICNPKLFTSKNRSTIFEGLRPTRRPSWDFQEDVWYLVVTVCGSIFEPLWMNHQNIKLSEASKLEKHVKNREKIMQNPFQICIGPFSAPFRAQVGSRTVPLNLRSTTLGSFLLENGVPRRQFVTTPCSQMALKSHFWA